MITLYGINTCDACRKARNAMTAVGVAHAYVDLRGPDVTRETIAGWVDRLGWETVLNKNSTTWRSLDPDEKEALDAEKALALLDEHRTLIKRPVIESGAGVCVGWTAETRARAGLPE